MILAHKLLPRVRGLHLVPCEEVKREGLVGGREQLVDGREG